jgi:hypothetical protein
VCRIKVAFITFWTNIVSLGNAIMRGVNLSSWERSERKRQVEHGETWPVGELVLILNDAVVIAWEGKLSPGGVHVGRRSAELAIL